MGAGEGWADQYLPPRQCDVVVRPRGYALYHHGDYFDRAKLCELNVHSRVSWVRPFYTLYYCFVFRFGADTVLTMSG